MFKEWKNLHFVWKQFLINSNLQNIIYSNTLKNIFKEKYIYDETTDTFLGITSKYLPIYNDFIKFWESTITHHISNSSFEYDFEIDLLCFDEAHHILSNNMKELLFGIDTDDDFIESFIDTYSNKTLFFTATPKNSNNIMMYESVTCFDNYELTYDDPYITEELDCGKRDL